MKGNALGAPRRFFPKRPLRGHRGLVLCLRVYIICTRRVGWHVIIRHRAERKEIINNTEDKKRVATGATEEE